MKGQLRRYISQPPVLLAEGKKTSTITLTRTGRFYDERYGWFHISEPMLLQMVENFNNDVYGQQIFIDVAHNPNDGAAATVKSLHVDNGRLRAVVDWNPYGIAAVNEKGFVYLSAEYHENFVDNEQGQEHGAVLLGAALTTRPVIKRNEPVRLSEQDGDTACTGYHPQLLKQLQKEATQTMNKHLKKMREDLAALKLSEEVITAIIATYEQALKMAGEDEQAVRQLSETTLNQARTLAANNQPASGPEPQPAGTATTEPQQPASIDAKVLAETVVSIMDQRDKKLLEEKAEEQRQLAERQTSNRTMFCAIIDECNLSEDLKKELKEHQQQIDGTMNEAAVKALAQSSIQLGRVATSRGALQGIGYEIDGSTETPRFQVSDENAIKELQEHADRRCGLTDMPDSRRYANTAGALQPANIQLAERVMAHFDRQNGRALQQASEAMRTGTRLLAAGDAVTPDVSTPVVWERTVIREALYRLVSPQFVQADSKIFASSYSIPYSYRDLTAAGINDTRRYEGQAIGYAGVIQTAEDAYNIPQKLAIKASDEVRYLASGQLLDWNMVSEQTLNAGRIIGEDTDRLNFNEILNASDEYSVVPVANENLELQADDTVNILPLANFPVVRPRSVYNLTGAQVGSTTNPVTVTYNSIVRSEYDGTGTQAAGIYYVLDYNLGEIRLVDEAGVTQIPANGTAYTISYSYTTNVAQFDTVVPGASTLEAHWDDYLNVLSRRKDTIEDDRFYMANFMLMSGSHRTDIEQARRFNNNWTRPGTDLQADGNLGRVKNIPAFTTHAPGLAMGDVRALIGERFQTRYWMTKPWQMGEMENVVDSNGAFIGKKQSYGDQFAVIHTPTQLKAAMTSTVLYSSTGRVARVYAA